MHYNAKTIQYAMLGFLVILVGAIGAIFSYGDQFLSEKATETNHVRIDAELASQELINLQALEQDMSKDSAVIEKTKQIVAQSQMYQFQNQVIEDITGYADLYGITILGFNFGSKPGSAPPASQASGTGGSQQRTIVTVRLEDHIPYPSLIRFLKAIENNITKMQLTGIGLQPTENPTLLSGTTIEIEVFLR